MQTSRGTCHSSFFISASSNSQTLVTKAGEEGAARRDGEGSSSRPQGTSM